MTASNTGTEVLVVNPEFELLKEFKKLQEERCLAYNKMESCLAQCRQTSQTCSVTSTINSVTETFQSVSSAIIKIGEALRSGHFISSAVLIENLQEHEESKLKLTVEMNIKKQQLQMLLNQIENQKAENLRNESEGTSEHESQVKEIKSLQEGIRLCKHRHAIVVEKINNILEEVRYQMYPELS